jgi:omega-amidase
VKIVAVQLDISWEDKPANFDRVRRLLERSKPEKDSLVVLPEMFATGFSMNTGAIAESYGGPTEQFLSATAKEFGVCLVAGAAMRGRDNRAHNKALIFAPSGELLAYYSKMQPFGPGGEADHYIAGERPVTFDWLGWTVAPFICYDLRFPEIFRAVAAGHRPHLYVVIADWPDKRIHHWMRLLQARAIENQAYVAGVNCVGRDPKHVYVGRSMIVDFHGEIRVDAGDREGCFEADLDLTALNEYRLKLPFLADMKTAPARSPAA